MKIVPLLLVALATACALPGAVNPRSGVRTVFLLPPEPLTLAGATPGPTPVALSFPETPAVSFIDLTQRYRLSCGEKIPPPAAASRPAERVGDRRAFTVVDLASRRTLTRTATLRFASDRTYWYVQDGLPVNEPALLAAARQFEEKIAPLNRQVFGEEPETGPDGDPHLTLFYGQVSQGVGAYFYSPDMLPRLANPRSNERKIIFINVSGPPPDSEDFLATLAHEYQHLIHWGIHRHQQLWLNEGASELAMRLNGYSPGAFPQIYAASPDLRLLGWDPDPGGASPYYGAAYLFLSYLSQRLGGASALRELLSTPGEGPWMIDTYFRRAGRPERFDTIFLDWLTANYVNSSSVENGRYTYPEAPKVTARDLINQPSARPATVNQYGVRYIDITAPGDLEIEFQGFPHVKLLGTEPHSGRAFWWSNRGDQMDSTLTRAVDLTGVDRATLQFWTWYEIEEDFDHAYVAVSDDNGCTWKSLPTQRTTRANSFGTNLGNAFTGNSGGGDRPRWSQESADLSPWAGKRILLRFEYVTDDGYNAAGMALDDLRIPEINWLDDAETDGDWQAEGWVRTGAALPQTFGVRLLKFAADGEQVVAVDPLPLDANQFGRATVNGVGSALGKVTLLVSGLNRYTSEPAQFRYTVRPRVSR